MVRARAGSDRNGRSDPPRQEEDPAVLGLPGRRVRHQRSLCRRAGEAWRERARADHSDQADAGRRRGAEKVRRVGQRARRRNRDVGRVRRAGRVKTYPPHPPHWPYDPS